jgi:glucose-6-phosphate isomerase
MEVKKENKKLEIRRVSDLRDVLCDKEWFKTATNFSVYRVFRGAKKERGLIYDITVMPPRFLGKEFPKTKGNRNSNDFPELYTVLEGEALILMQKTKGKIVKDVVVIKAKKGECLIEPPEYAVITINPSRKTLKIGTWVSEKNKNIYEELKKMGGACYFYTISGWLKNKNYESDSKKKIPKLRFEKPLKKIPENLNFLYGKH